MDNDFATGYALGAIPTAATVTTAAFGAVTAGGLSSSLP